MNRGLVVEDVEKRFGNLYALDGISLSVSEGECVGLIGPNGAGKTTLFNVITGFMKPEKGKIEYNGKSLIGLPPEKIQKIGLTRTFQAVQVFDNLTVKENILIGTTGKKVEPSEDVFCDEILSKLGFSGKEDLPAKDLSHGMKKRLGIGIGMATSPEVLLLDEPFGGIESKEIKDVVSILSELHEEGLTEVIVDHKVKNLLEFVDRAIVMNAGEVICEGEPSEIVEDKEVRRVYLEG
ncbi:hypothetical protein AKJ62_03405 [candidate division MSBL1 archaeon SCGC-AAA259D14]|uniref:ABC transporter domain-containing protein n=1 Tax=candidate division MSBL1 archaeon SCGC-AAA259D14 TaxID=1698261 RepID=A0A133U525_9EURY|nr:hypothetical protein AKJ62_03405 [candidate division MSBL1 archaeon SCGC-AAA259D14]